MYIKKIISITVVFLLITSVANAQHQGDKLASATVKNLNGKSVNTADFSNNSKPIVISFWATWCSPCKKELNNISDVYDDWVEQTGVKLIAISIDDTKTKAKVNPYVNQQSWDYEVYTDENGDFKRAMGVNTVPHVFLINGKGEIVWQHNNYSEGDEDELYEEILKLTKN